MTQAARVLFWICRQARLRQRVYLYDYETLTQTAQHAPRPRLSLSGLSPFDQSSDDAPAAIAGSGNMHIIKPAWLVHGGESSPPKLLRGRRKTRQAVFERDANIKFTTGEIKDHEVYSCHVSPDGKRLVTAAGGEL